jgi:hypothetical protein
MAKSKRSAVDRRQSDDEYFPNSRRSREGKDRRASPKEKIPAKKLAPVKPAGP